MAEIELPGEFLVPQVSVVVFVVVSGGDIDGDDIELVLLLWLSKLHENECYSFSDDGELCIAGNAFPASL